MNDNLDNFVHPWMDAARARGLAPFCRTLLEITEPAAPIAANILWVLQPTARLLGGGTAIGQLAQALETPEGIAALREYLRDEEIE